MGVRQKNQSAKSHREKMERLFYSADASKTGALTVDDLVDVLQDEAVRQWLAGMEFPVLTGRSEIERLFTALDRNGDGAISMNELVHGVSEMKGTARSRDLIYLLQDVQEVKMMLSST